MSALFWAALAIIGFLLAVADFKWSHVFPRLARRVRSLRKVQRITWDDRFRDWRNPERSSVFKDSRSLFCSLPDDLFDDPGSKEWELDRIASWLQDDAFTTKAEEIYIVARPGWFSHEIHGLLYATVDEGTKDRDPNTCGVWYLTASNVLSAHDRLAMCARMWRKLTDEVARTCDPESATYVFFVEARYDEAREDIRDYMALLRTFLSGRADAGSVTGKVLDLAYYAPAGGLVPKTAPEDADEGIVLAVDADRRDAHELLRTIYKMHFWGFVYPDELPTLGMLAKRAQYYADLEAMAVGETPEGVVQTLGLGSEGAESRGFTWKPLAFDAPDSGHIGYSAPDAI